ncbi:MAG TPA: PTS sugar transporter subunit IIA [Haliangium sp.]|nr:PTS sugar transporter subunit IIA [Haliangium sp.]
MKKQEMNGAGRSMMTLAECAGYLHLSEKTVLKLAQDSELPGVMNDRKWVFERDRVDDWLAHQRDDEVRALEDILDGTRVPLDELMPEEAIIDDLRSENALGVIEELAARAYSNNWLSDKPWFIGAVVERECLSSTAMEGGIAFLHTRERESARVARPFIVVGRSYGGIDFGAPDGRPTFLFFLLGLRHDKLHLPVLGRLARIMRSPATVAKLRALPSSTKIRALLLKKDAEARASSPEHPTEHEQLRPQMDRHTRLRAIMRVDAQRKHKARKADADSKKKSTQKSVKPAKARQPKRAVSGSAVATSAASLASAPLRKSAGARTEPSAHDVSES